MFCKFFIFSAYIMVICQVKALTATTRLLLRETKISGISRAFFPLMDVVYNTGYQILWERKKSCWFQLLTPTLFLKAEGW